MLPMDEDSMKGCRRVVFIRTVHNVSGLTGAPVAGLTETPVPGLTGATVAGLAASG